MNAVTIRWKVAFEANCAFWYEAWLEYVLDGCCALHCIDPSKKESVQNPTKLNEFFLHSRFANVKSVYATLAWRS